MPQTQQLKQIEERFNEYVAKLKEFLHEKYYTSLVAAANEEKPLVIDYKILEKFNPDLALILLDEPAKFFEISEEAVKQTELPSVGLYSVQIRTANLPYSVSIRDLRAKHLAKFVCVEGIVRRASEIRPEILEVVWECPECGEKIIQERLGNIIFRPLSCACGNRRGFKEIEKIMIDTRWLTIEEPFELTEGERPSQVNIVLRSDLVSPEGRSLTEPGNRLKINGVLKEIPKGKLISAKLDFYLDANHVEPTEIGLERLKITKEDEKTITELAKTPEIYEMLVDSLAPSLYGLREIKESIILQLFSGVQRILKDRTRFRGEIHILLIGDPASGKSQLLKLVPQIIPRGKYVSGKGVTAAGLTASVTKDEVFMGGWVLEAGAIVLANKGLLSIDEFEKMSTDDQVAMHEALEQGSVSIAKASIVASLPAQTSVLAGGNPKLSRFDPYVPIAKQITIPETLLSRFDLKFALKDVPDAETDKRVVDHIVSSRDEAYEASKPKINAEVIRKYIAYAKERCKPELTEEAARVLKRFYLKTRKKAEAGGAIPITLRQFEALIRLSEASAKIQLSNKVRKEDAMRAIKLMRYSLRQLGFDPETGQIDIDRAEGATTATERSRIKVMIDIINLLSEKKKEIPVYELISEAKKENMEESEAEEIIERLKREGMLFEPNPGFVQKV